MKRILFIVLIAVLFVLGASSVSAKEDTHFEVEKGMGSSALITLKDSSNNPIAGKIDINITKPNGYVKIFQDKKLNKTGQIEYFLGTTSGQYVVSIYFKGDSNHNPCSLTKTITVNGGSGNSPYYYYDSHNYGDSLRMDEYIYDNYWYEDIYDDPYTYDGEWY